MAPPRRQNSIRDTMISVNIIPIIFYKNNKYVIYEENVYPSPDGLKEEDLFTNAPQFQIKLPKADKDFEECKLDLANAAIKKFSDSLMKSNILKGVNEEQGKGEIKFEQKTKSPACIVRNDAIYCYCEFYLEFANEGKIVDTNVIDKYKVLYFRYANFLTEKIYSIYEYDSKVAEDNIGINYSDIIDAVEKIIFRGVADFEESSIIIDMLETELIANDPSYNNKTERKTNSKITIVNEKPKKKTTKSETKAEPKAEPKNDISDNKSISDETDITDSKSMSSDATTKKKGRPKGSKNTKKTEETEQTSVDDDL